jgi:hypothetical protein
MVNNPLIPRQLRGFPGRKQEKGPRQRPVPDSQSTATRAQGPLRPSVVNAARAAIQG